MSPDRPRRPWNPKPVHPDKLRDPYQIDRRTAGRLLDGKNSEVNKRFLRVLDGVTDLTHTAMATLVALGVFLAVTDGGPEGDSRNRSAIAGQEHAGETDQMLVERLRKLPALLKDPAALQKRSPRLAELLAPGADAQEQCFYIRDVMGSHLQDVLEVAVYLTGEADKLDNAGLREQFRSQRTKILAELDAPASGGDPILSQPEQAMKIMEKRMANTRSFKAIQRCRALTMAFFGGFVNAGIHDNKEKLEPIIEEIAKGVGEKNEAALRAARAMGKIANTLVGRERQ